MRILIADDDPLSRTVLTALLEKCGYEVVPAANGAEAWQAMQQPDAPRIVILDWMMPELDGMELCRRIRKVETDQPPHIIMLTSKGEKADIITGLEAGADDYLAKPFDAGELRARINAGRRLIEMQNKLLDARNALAHQAAHDSLTGVLNRRAILDALTRELARERRISSGLTVGMCDVDHFKQVNDAYGHQVGDEVLCGLVRLLEGSLRQYDYLGRLGGEEFAVIASNIKGQAVSFVYERLRTAIADNPIPTRQGNLWITLSIGVAVWHGNMTENELLAAADAALYEAKNRGRNRVCLA